MNGKLRVFLLLVVFGATLLGTFGSAVVLTTQAAYAQGTDDEGPIVRRKLLYRSTRLEVAPHAGFTLNDPYRRNILAGAALAFHLTNEFAVGASFAYAPVHLETNLSQNVEARLEQANPGTLNRLGYSVIQWAGDFGLQYVPLFGKFTLFNATSLNYDIHLGGGVAVIQEAGVAAVANGDVDEQLNAFRPGGVATIGLRLFVSDMFSINADLKNMFYSGITVSSGSADPELKHTAMATVGIGIFFPGSVKISR